MAYPIYSGTPFAPGDPYMNQQIMQGYVAQNPNPWQAPTITGAGGIIGGSSRPRSTGGISPFQQQQYMGMLTGDPWYMAQNNLLSAQGISDAAQRQQAVQQALIRFGQVPTMAQFESTGPGPKPVYSGPSRPMNYGAANYGTALSAYNRAMADYQRALNQWKQAGGGAKPNLWQQDVTELVRQAAAQNTGAGLSQTAMLAKANEDARRNITNQMAARGILSSGETGYQLGEQSLRNQQAEYGARNELTDYLNGIYAAYAQAEQQRAAQRLAMLQDAYGRQASRLPSNFNPTL